ncbi:DUF1294 domain-containing protein [Psychromonas sp. Urea-02u-13]|uniref:DUF1294 domain-containing protein n=1 Tax=Psychromonas sp. Urea-02u-13 TaxID=2058326 RepID=UPI000C31DE7F|nr:cold shock and DUF1294 domain-containing protein [Psychromonas sp. Urea-02u-13]PKG39113.1 DUF1294 domain-containing protein [Psychromonas sp. Urea-02u-13]
MKLQGKVINWNDDKGFGFVEPNGGGERAFVHIKAFKPRSRRPVNGEVITYELVRENNNRHKAENIKFARDVNVKQKRSANHNHQHSNAKNGGVFGVFLTVIFGVGLLASVFIGKLPLIIVGLYCVMSLIAFVAYAIDKSAAQNGRWRTKENTLHLLALLGGWPGAYFAQQKLRHKSSKQAFKSVYWLTVLLNLGGLFWLHTESGATLLNNTIMPLLNG